MEMHPGSKDCPLNCIVYTEEREERKEGRRVATCVLLSLIFFFLNWMGDGGWSRGLADFLFLSYR